MKQKRDCKDFCEERLRHLKQPRDIFSGMYLRKTSEKTPEKKCQKIPFENDFFDCPLLQVLRSKKDLFVRYIVFAVSQISITLTAFFIKLSPRIDCSCTLKHKINQIEHVLEHFLGKTADRREDQRKNIKTLQTDGILKGAMRYLLNKSQTKRSTLEEIVAHIIEDQPELRVTQASILFQTQNSSGTDFTTLASDSESAHFLR